MAGKVIGIDLGTSLSCVCYREGNETRVIPNLIGERLTPSVVAFTDEGRVVGRAAKAQAATNPARTIASAKRLIGRLRREVTDEEKLLPYAVVGEPDELAQIEVDGKRYYPSQISAMVLQDLKKSAEAFLSTAITDCVISCPAYFNDSQRQATKEAGKIAGLNVLRIINEPTAAALAYGLDKKKSEKVIVVDCGGGTHDISILALGEGIFQVISTAGDNHLGGDDFDHALVDYIADQFKREKGVDIRKDPMALQRLNEACEKAKCDLSTVPQAAINLPYITAVNGQPQHLTHTVTRATFEELLKPYLERFEAPIRRALADANLSPQQIQEVVLVGGSTRIPKIQEICKAIFGREPHKGVNPDEVVGIGAALQAAILSGDVHDIVLLDVTPLSLGVETMGGIFSVMIPRNTTIPTSKMETYSTAVDNQPAVDIHVLQGERKMSADNRTLGRFQLTGIPPQPRGVPLIEVTFDIDANGIATVTSLEKNTGKKQSIEIKASSGLEKDQVEQMVRDAQSHEAEDKLRAELAELRNKADATCHSSELSLKEHGAKLSNPCKVAVEEAVQGLRTCVARGEDRTKLETAMVKLDEANRVVATELQKLQQAAQNAAQATVPQQQAEPQPPPTPQPKMDSPGQEIGI